MKDWLDGTAVRAVLLDVDGTLYRQSPVRRGMLWRLIRQAIVRPGAGIRTMRALSAYRRAQEALRADAYEGEVETAQCRLASRRTGIPQDVVRDCVGRWIDREPLDLVARARREGLIEFLHAARAHGVRVGVVSDYPASAKLAALGLDRLVDITVTAQDAEVQAFKPNPRCLEVALRRLDRRPQEAIYVGDRSDIDPVAASRAGMPCVIIGSLHARPGADRVGDWTSASGFPELTERLFGHQ